MPCDVVVGRRYCEVSSVRFESWKISWNFLEFLGALYIQHPSTDVSNQFSSLYLFGQVHAGGGRGLPRQVILQSIYRSISQVKSNCVCVCMTRETVLMGQWCVCFGSILPSSSVPHHPSNLLRTSLINSLIYDLTVERRTDAQDTDTHGIDGKGWFCVAFFVFLKFISISFPSLPLPKPGIGGFPTGVTANAHSRGRGSYKPDA